LLRGYPWETEYPREGNIPERNTLERGSYTGEKKNPWEGILGTPDLKLKTISGNVHAHTHVKPSPHSSGCCHSAKDVIYLLIVASKGWGGGMEPEELSPANRPPGSYLVGCATFV